jgi:hypothetical protein
LRQDLSLPPGLHGDDTTYAAKGRWGDGSNVRFRLGMAETIGGWESLTSDLLTGVCRTIFPWKDNGEVLNIAFGTHSKLQVWKGGGLYDITPYGPPDRLGENPFSVTNLSAVVTVTHVAHGYTTGDSLKIYGSTATGGISAANLDGTRTITVTGDDAYTFTAGANASSTTTGGGANVVVTPQSALPAGAENGTGSIGYGTGAYGVGPYGTTSLTTEYYPRTWSFDAWGQYLLASPRGGGLYEWQNNTASRAVAINNAPTQITYMLVAPLNGGYQAFALGCEEEVSGTFNPMCIRHSSIRDNTEWSTLASGSTAREYILTGGGRIVAGRMVGPYMLVWTDKDLFVGTFVGALNQPWRFDRVGRNCGLIGPNAAIVVGQTAYWASPDRQFFRYGIGGQPEPLECPIRSDFAAYLATSQGDKVVASSNSEFSEIRFDYPDRRDGEGYENSRYIALCLSGSDAGAWHRGIMARTAFVDAGPSLYPLATTATGNVFYHEKGNSADGASFAWFIETAGANLDPDQRLLIRGIWPDFKDQLGPVTVTMRGREHPQDEGHVQASSPMAASDVKADLLITGRIFNMRISGESAPTKCRIGKPVFDVAPAGQY